MEKKNKLFIELTEELKAKGSIDVLSFNDIFDKIWEEAQKELLEELKKDFANGNNAEHICMKFIDKSKDNKQT